MTAVEHEGAAISALPDEWALAWGNPSPFYRREVNALKSESELLAQGIPCLDHEDALGHLVHPSANRDEPVHRWFAYKEAYAPALAREVVGRLGTGTSKAVVDTFGGVATTQMALMSHPAVAKVLGVEYSPIAQFVGATKLQYLELDLMELDAAIAEAGRFHRAARADVPGLAAFSNPEIFDADVVRDLVGARDHVLAKYPEGAVRSFLLLAIAAIAEDCSYVMKDGRALRIARGRTRRSSSIAGLRGERTVRAVLKAQLAGMRDDVARRQALQPTSSHRAATAHLKGDARDLDAALTGQVAPGEVGLFVYSPPYLNCIDYTEVYKLESWLLGLISTQDEFRTTRLGTLRSHPSVEFPDRGYIDKALGWDHDVAFLLRALPSFVERNHVRPNIGRMIRNYFDDMCRVLEEQLRYLEPGGHAVCVVANSTFSRRDRRDDGTWDERWRIPVLTDVLIARLGTALGFVDPQIWRARDLRPRNVEGGAARESLVVLRKPGA